MPDAGPRVYASLQVKGLFRRAASPLGEGLRQRWRPAISPLAPQRGTRRSGMAKWTGSRCSSMGSASLRRRHRRRPVHPSPPSLLFYGQRFVEAW